MRVRVYMMSMREKRKKAVLQSPDERRKKREAIDLWQRESDDDDEIIDRVEIGKAWRWTRRREDGRETMEMEESCLSFFVVGGGRVEWVIGIRSEFLI